MGDPPSVPLADFLERLLALHDEVGSPLRGFLRPGLAESTVRERLGDLALVPPPQLTELYGLHDGVDEEAWNRSEAGAGYALLGHDGVRFPSLERAVVACNELRASDEDMAATPWWDLAPGDLWRPSWFPVFALTRSDENVAIDCDPGSRDFGAVRVVRWEAVQDSIVAQSIDAFLLLLADRFEASKTTWNADARHLDCDESLAGPDAWP